MTLAEIYESQPTLESELIRLRPVENGDAEALLACYGDPNAVPFFNADNCNGDDFHYTTLARMREAIDFWAFSYGTRQFVRWAVEDQSLGEVVGTVEMFHHDGDADGDAWGILRVDLQSRFETRAFLYAVISLCLRHFYEGFEVKRVLVKAIPGATERRAALEAAGFIPFENTLNGYPFYFERKR